MNLFLESGQDSIRPYYSIGSVSSAMDSSQKAITEASNKTTSIMTTRPTVGHKRTRSQVDSADANGASTEGAPPIRAILIHLSALLSSEAAITYTIRTLLSKLLHENEITQVSEEAILRAFTTSPRIYNILRELGMRELTADEMSRMEALYTVIFFTQAWPLLDLDQHAKVFLEEATSQHPHLRLAAMSNNTPKATELLEKLGVRELEMVIPTPAVQAINEGSLAYETFWDTWKRLIVPWFNDPSSNPAWDDFDKDGSLKDDKVVAGKKAIDKDTTDKEHTNKSTANNGITPKDSVNQSNKDTTALSATHPTDNPSLTPNKKHAPFPPSKSCHPSTCNTNNYHGPGPNPHPSAPPLKPSEVMVISCALYDLGIAKLAGMQTCWLRKIRADDEVAVRVAGNFDMVAGDLEEVRVRLFGGVDGEEEEEEEGCVKNGVKVKEEGGGGEVMMKEEGEDMDMDKGKEKEVTEKVKDEDEDLVLVSVSDKKEPVVEGSGEENEVVMMEIDDY